MKEKTKENKKVTRSAEAPITKNRKANENLKLKEIKEFFNSELGSLIKILVVIAVVIAIFLFITNVIKNNASVNGEPNNAKVQYEEILMSNIFKQNKSSYYVLMYNENDTYAETYELYLSTYAAKAYDTKMYNVRLNIGFNSSYIADESNIVSNINEFKVKGATLIKVENNNIVESYEDSTAIINKLKEIIG